MSLQNLPLWVGGIILTATGCLTVASGQTTQTAASAPTSSATVQIVNPPLQGIDFVAIDATTETDGYWVPYPTPETVNQEAARLAAAAPKPPLDPQVAAIAQAQAQQQAPPDRPTVIYQSSGAGTYADPYYDNSSYDYGDYGYVNSFYYSPTVIYYPYYNRSGYPYGHGGGDGNNHGHGGGTPAHH